MTLNVETKQPRGTVFGPDNQRQDGQRYKSADQRRGPRQSKEHDDLAPAQNVEMVERATDGEVLDRRKAEHCHHCDNSKRQRDAERRIRL